MKLQRVGLELSEEFEVKADVHQGSVLLLLVLGNKVVTEGARNGLLSEMLHADDLVLMSETMEGLREKFWKWKDAFEGKLVKVNFGKTKVVGSGAEGQMSVSKVDPCGICGKRVMANLVCEMQEIEQ